MLEPDAHGADLITQLVSVRVDPSVVGQDYFRLLGVVGFMVPGNGCYVKFVLTIRRTY